MRVWTDGAEYAPYPLPPSIVKCPHCRRLHWFSTDVEVGTITDSPKGRERAPRKWRNAELGQQPDEQEYYHAIETGLAQTPGEERSLRLLAWRRSNDEDRQIEYTWFTRGPRSPSGRNENLTALLPLLEETGKDLVFKAEIYRELRMWRQALETLGRGGSQLYPEAVERIRALCDLEDDKVREIEFPDIFKPRRSDSPEQRLPFRIFEQPISCPHCHAASSRFRQVTGRMICPVCARSFTLE
ncbi:MAG TPA: hypothetical protein VJN43_12005 [Bryobacteraceae bacterium]|nr:hypothetical protein [Bryobacteraceae bacterium]